MKTWIQGIFAASLLSALALALCPPGRVRAVTRLACGIVCSLAVVSPLAHADISVIARELAAYEQRAYELTASEEETGNLLKRTYIEEECAAYISARAEQMGSAAANVTVQARWDDAALVWYPWSAALDAPYDPALSRVLEAELGIPAARQTWNGGGGSGEEAP